VSSFLEAVDVNIIFLLGLIKETKSVEETGLAVETGLAEGTGLAEATGLTEGTSLAEGTGQSEKSFTVVDEFDPDGEGDEEGTGTVEANVRTGRSVSLELKLGSLFSFCDLSSSNINFPTLKSSVASWSLSSCLFSRPKPEIPTTFPLSSSFVVSTSLATQIVETSQSSKTKGGILSFSLFLLSLWKKAPTSSTFHGLTTNSCKLSVIILKSCCSAHR